MRTVAQAALLARGIAHAQPPPGANAKVQPPTVERLSASRGRPCRSRYAMNRPRRSILAVISILLAGCGGLGGPRTLHVGEAELQARLMRHFPLQRRLLGLLDLQLSAPRLRLLPQANRLATAFDFTVGSQLNGRRRSGQIEVEYGLRYDADGAAIRLVQPRILRLDTGAGDAARLPEPAQELVEAALDGMALYRVPPERLKHLRASGLQPGALSVTERGVDLRLDPMP